MPLCTPATTGLVRSSIMRARHGERTLLALLWLLGACVARPCQWAPWYSALPFSTRVPVAGCAGAVVPSSCLGGSLRARTSSPAGGGGSPVPRVSNTGTAWRRPAGHWHSSCHWHCQCRRVRPAPPRPPPAAVHVRRRYSRIYFFTNSTGSGHGIAVPPLQGPQARAGTQLGKPLGLSDCQLRLTASQPGLPRPVALGAHWHLELAGGLAWAPVCGRRGLPVGACSTASYPWPWRSAP